MKLLIPKKSTVSVEEQSEVEAIVLMIPPKQKIDRKVLNFGLDLDPVSEWIVILQDETIEIIRTITIAGIIEEIPTTTITRFEETKANDSSREIIIMIARTITIPKTMIIEIIEAVTIEITEATEKRTNGIEMITTRMKIGTDLMIKKSMMTIGKTRPVPTRLHYPDPILQMILISVVFIKVVDKMKLL
jgi:hypothetical protein